MSTLRSFDGRDPPTEAEPDHLDDEWLNPEPAAIEPQGPSQPYEARYW